MKQVLYFSIGAAVGGLVGWYLTKRHYESFIDEEIEEVKERYKEDNEEEHERKIYKKRLDTLGYAPKLSNDIEVDEYVKDEVEEDLKVTNPFPGERVDVPYTITPDEFLNSEEGVFDKETITYYAGNGELVSDADEILMIPDTIGYESLENFGEYEENTVFVRNEKLGMDFEVVRVEGSYEPQ